MNYNRLFLPVSGQQFGNAMPYNYSLFDMLSKLGNGIRKFNWRGLLSGVNKTLTTVNQTIPLIKQAKPMFNNVKSLIVLTKTFRNEAKNSNSVGGNYKDNRFFNHNIVKKSKSYDNYNSDTSDKPTFFI